MREPAHKLKTFIVSASLVADAVKTSGGSNVAERSAVGSLRSDRGAFGHNKSTSRQDLRYGLQHRENKVNVRILWQLIPKVELRASGDWIQN